MSERILKDAIMVEAEKEVLRIKREAQDEINKRKKEDEKAIKREAKNYLESKKKEIESKFNERYFKMMHEIKKKYSLEKKKYLEDKSDELIGFVLKFDEKQKERLYREMYHVVRCVFSSGVIRYPKVDEKIVKKIFKGYELKVDEDISFGVIAEGKDAMIDLSLENLKGALKEKIRAMLI